MHGDYFASTMLLSIAKLIPVILFAAAGYFVFIKLPFWVFLKIHRASKGLDYKMPDFKFETPDYKPNYSVENYEAFLRKQKMVQEQEVRLQQMADNILEFERFQKEQKHETEEEKRQRAEQNERRKKYAEELRQKASAQTRQREEERLKKKREKEDRERYARQEQEQEERRKRDTLRSASEFGGPELVFNFKPGETISKEDLRKRYHDLLKVHHPDKVLHMNEEARKRADKKTKEINAAYEKLKGRAA